MKNLTIQNGQLVSTPKFAQFSFAELKEVAPTIALMAEQLGYNDQIYTFGYDTFYDDLFFVFKNGQPYQKFIGWE
jgi:hypothetical protein